MVGYFAGALVGTGFHGRVSRQREGAIFFVYTGSHWSTFRRGVVW